MEGIYDFFSDNAGTIGSIIVGAVVVIIIIAWVDRHPSKSSTKQHNEPRRDDE